MNKLAEEIGILEEMIENANIENMDMNDCFGGEHIEAIEHILSDYKRVLKENEELKEDRDKFKKALGRKITYCNELEKDLFENSSNYVIKKQKVKDKIEELNKAYEDSKDENGESEYYYPDYTIRVLEGLL